MLPGPHVVGSRAGGGRSGWSPSTSGRGTMEDLEGRVALVTGASRGVGAATAVALAEAGCDVACAARSTRDGPQRTRRHPRRDGGAGSRRPGAGAWPSPPIWPSTTRSTAMVDRTVDHFGRLDVLVNNAAITFVGDLDIPLKPLRPGHAGQPASAAPRHPRGRCLPCGRGGGTVVNVSSVAALHPYPSLMAYGMSKIGLERLTVDAAAQLAPVGIAVNCFRIDMPVASEGFVANTPGADHSNWEPSEVAAEGIVWMARQPPSYTGHRESMFALRRRAGIMSPRVRAPHLHRSTRRAHRRCRAGRGRLIGGERRGRPPLRRAGRRRASRPVDGRAGTARVRRTRPRALHQRRGVERDLRDRPRRVRRRPASATHGGAQGQERDHAARVPGARGSERHRRAPPRGVCACDRCLGASARPSI